MARRHTPATPEHVARTWDRSAPRYDSLYAHGLQSHQEVREWTLLLLQVLGPGPLRILDVGCGTGVLTLLLAKLGHDVTGIDLSEGMLRKARENTAGTGVTVELRRAEGTGFADDAFDAVISRQVLWTLPDPALAVQEWIRVTRPGGRVIAIDGLWHDPAPLARLSVLAGNALARVQGGPVYHRDDSYWNSPDDLPLFHLRSFAPVHNLFVRAGLERVLIEELERIDRIERSVMPLYEKLRNRHRRYLVEGWVPRGGAPARNSSAEGHDGADQ